MKNSGMKSMGETSIEASAVATPTPVGSSARILPTSRNQPFVIARLRTNLITRLDKKVASIAAATADIRATIMRASERCHLYFLPFSAPKSMKRPAKKQNIAENIRMKSIVPPFTTCAAVEVF